MKPLIKFFSERGGDENPLALAVCNGSKILVFTYSNWLPLAQTQTPLPQRCADIKQGEEYGTRLLMVYQQLYNNAKTIYHSHHTYPGPSQEL